MSRVVIAFNAVFLAALAACSTTEQDPYALQRLPDSETYCLDAQRVVTRTTVPMTLEVHDDFDSFVKSKAVIEGPTIHQYNWYSDAGELQGISCKMKSADHLMLEFGVDSAGPDGLCHDMNRQVYALLKKQVRNPAVDTVLFIPSESLDTSEQRNMIGPIWLLPFTMTYLDANNELQIATKGFTINFTDERYQKFPPSWRGTHYCHLIAPDYFAGLLAGTAQPGATIGQAAKELRRPPSN